MSRRAPNNSNFVYSYQLLQVGTGTEDRQERLKRKPVLFADGGRS